MTNTFVIDPSGEFSLREAALFGFGPRDEQSFDGVMRLAFCLDSLAQPFLRDLVGEPTNAVSGCCNAIIRPWVTLTHYPTVR